MFVQTLILGSLLLSSASCSSERKVDPHYGDTTPMGFLKRSTKSTGAGYILNVGGSYNIYTDPFTKIRSTTSNNYFYFYRDDGKYYIRDEKCNFVCANPCGEVFVSAYRLQHYCKFKVIQDPATSAFKIYIPSSGSVPTYRALEFLVKDNLLRAKVGIKNEAEVPALFFFKDPVKIQNKCPSISKVQQYNLDAHPDNSVPDNRCAHLNTRVLAENRITGSLPLKSESVRYFHLMMDSKYINGAGGFSETSGSDTIFQQHYLKPNVFAFRSVQSCSFLCQNKCGFVYVTKKYNDDCMIRVEQSSVSNSFFLRFTENNFFLAYNTTTDTLGHTDRARSRLSFVDATVSLPDECPRLDLDKREERDNKCALSLANNIVINIPHMLFLILLNYNATRV
uniref:Fgf-2 n=1 Tax=Agrotis segetum granulosis virus TaxID=10464 RepID=A0A023MII7_GVAS|nr:fgf-2 [Agrotis segetum granulovirus]